MKFFASATFAICQWKDKANAEFVYSEGYNTRVLALTFAEKCIKIVMLINRKERLVCALKNDKD